MYSRSLKKINLLLKKYHSLLLVLILAFSFFNRVAWLSQPPEYYFDEVYHALTAKLISRDDPRAYEWWNPPVEEDTAVDWLHPPLAKYFQSFSISIFGENSFGWRFSSVIFGVLVIFVTYKLADELFDNQNLALLSAFLASLDGLLLAQSRIAMNDIHVTFFILLTLLFYLRYKKRQLEKHLLLTAIAGGLALASKWSGLFVILLVIFFEGLDIVRGLLAKKVIIAKKTSLTIQKTFKLLLLFVFLPLVIYISSYSHMFSQGKTLICKQKQSIQGVCYFERFELLGWKWEGYVSHFVELHRQIIVYQTTLKATHPYQSRPIQWFFNSRPVWLHVDYGQDKIANIYSQGNHALFWLGGLTVIMSLLILLGQIFSKKIKQLASHPHLFFLVCAYFAVWLPWQLSPRIMFFYHYTPAVPLLGIILAYWLIKVAPVRIKRWKRFPVGAVILILAISTITLNFVIFYPNWVGISVPQDFANSVYFAYKNWR